MDADDYFGDDDFVLDDTALAVLDKAESQFKEAQRLTQQVVGERRPADAPPPIAAPPLKRQKTSHGGGGEEPLFVIQNVEDDEGLPEISILGRGSYRYPAAANALAAQLHGNVEVPSAGSFARPPDPVRNAVRSPPSAPAQNIPVPRTVPPSQSSPAVNTSSRPPAAAFVPPAPVQPSGVQPRPGPSAPRRSSTLSSIQAALAGFVPPPTNPSQNTRASSARPTPSAQPSRTPRNVGPSRRVSPAFQASQSRASIQPSASTPNVSRPALPAARPALPPNRRQSVPSTSRPPLAIPSQAQPRPPPLLPQPPPARSDPNVQSELEALRAQIADLLKDSEETKKVLEEERNARYAKQGEVVILRKNMEKAEKDHAAEVARMKAVREAAEAAQAQLRKEISEERERLRTEYMFKRHELETTVRKTPWSVRIKRTDNQVPGSPVSAATPRRQAVSSSHSGGSSNFQTPSRSRIDKSLPNSPQRQRRTKLVDSPPPKKSSRLMGFVNAFDASPGNPNLRFSQVEQSTQVNGKGKQRIEQPSFDFQGPQAEDLFFNPRPTQEEVHTRSSPASSPQEELQEDVLIPDVPAQKDSSGPSSSAEPVTSSPAEEDVEMKDEVKVTAKAEEPVVPVEPLFAPDWTKELQRIILTHKHHSSGQHTLTLLIDHTMQDSVSMEVTQAYSTQIAQLLESLGEASHKSSEVDVDDAIHSVGRILFAMGRALSGVGSIVTLAALLNLVKVVSLLVPSFIPLALAPGEEGVDAPPELLLLLCEVVRDHLKPLPEAFDESRSELATEALGLLEAVCWYTPSELALRLSVFIRKAGVLSALINPAHPTWLLLRVIRALTLAASYPTLWKHFLAFPLSEAAQEEAVAQDSLARIPHIEQLASFLTDRARDGPECRPLREAILNFITTLAVAHTDSLLMLIQSHTLLPSIIVFMHSTSAPLWEEDESFMEDPELITWTVDVMTRTLVLLHHLMTKADAAKINLRAKIMYPPRRFSNALWHMFTVSLGRISYAPPPEWAGPNAPRLDEICDMAKDVLEIAVDGPELESIWAAFQVDESVPAPRTQHGRDAGGEEDDDDDDEALPRGTAHSVIEID